MEALHLTRRLLAEKALAADLHPQFIVLKDPTPVERSLSKQPDFFKALPQHTAHIVMPARVANAGKGCQWLPGGFKRK